MSDGPRTRYSPVSAATLDEALDPVEGKAVAGHPHLVRGINRHDRMTHALGEAVHPADAKAQSFLRGRVALIGARSGTESSHAGPHRRCASSSCIRS